MMSPRTLIGWSDVFGIILEDLDGFPYIKEKGGVGTVPITLKTFLEGFSFCCCRVHIYERYKVLEALLN